MFNKSPAPSPDPAAIVAARAEACLTQQLCANIVYTGIRRWQDWEAGAARMPPATWELFLLKSRHAAELRPVLTKLSEFMNSPVLAINQHSEGKAT